MKGFRFSSSQWIMNSLSLFGVVSFAALMMSLKGIKQDNVIEAEKIILKGPDGQPSIILDAMGGAPKITLLSKNGSSQIEIMGGDQPKILMKDALSGKELIQLAVTEDGSSLIALKDAAGFSRVQLQGGNLPAYFLKNEQGEIIGTLLTLQDGGAAIGLADKEGDVSAFIRGGYTPSISFFQKSAEPQVALGISRQVPHLLVASPSTKDNLVLHGGEPASLLFVDENGEIPVLLSKHGLFQGKKQESSGEPKKDDKIFTWDELKNPLKDIQLPKR